MKPPKFIEIWTHQWMLESGVVRQEKKGALLLRAERLTEDLNLAAEMGFDAGIEAGRSELRREIESGEVVVPVKENA